MRRSPPRRSRRRRNMPPSHRTATAPNHAQPEGEHAQPKHHDQSIGGMIRGMVWPVANFIVFLGVLYYFFNQPLQGLPCRPQRDDPKGSRRCRGAARQRDRAAGVDRTEAAGAAWRSQRAARPRRGRYHGRRTTHRRRRGRRSRTAARTDASRDRSAGPPGEAGNPRARRRPVGAARDGSHQEGSHACRSGSARRSVSLAGERRAVDVASTHSANRYAKALFDVALEEKADLAKVDQDLDAVVAMMKAQPRSGAWPPAAAP